jgi:hypothetical protein
VGWARPCTPQPTEFRLRRQKMNMADNNKKPTRPCSTHTQGLPCTSCPTSRVNPPTLDNTDPDCFLGKEWSPQEPSPRLQGPGAHALPHGPGPAGDCSSPTPTEGSTARPGGAARAQPAVRRKAHPLSPAPQGSEDDASDRHATWAGAGRPGAEGGVPIARLPATPHRHVVGNLGLQAPRDVVPTTSHPPGAPCRTPRLGSQPISMAQGDMRAGQGLAFRGQQGVPGAPPVHVGRAQVAQ